MKKGIIIGLIIFCLILIGSLELTAKNRRTITTYQEKLIDYSKIESDSKEVSSKALGAFASDGGSPGYIIGRSWKDDQNHLNTGRMIDWGVNPQVHFIYTAQMCGGLYNPSSCARWIHYNMFDPTTSPGGVFVNGTTGLPLQMSPFSEAGMYPNLAIDENGRMISVAEAMTSSSGLRWTRLWWDISPTGWGDFLNDSIPDQNIGTGFDENRHYPIVEYQEYGGMYVTHLIALNGLDPLDSKDKLVAYWRKENSQSGLGGSWTMTQIADGPWSDTYDMAVSRDGSGKVVIAYCMARDPEEVLGSAIWVMTSNDAGVTWSSQEDIVPFTLGEASWQGWNECTVIIDSDNYAHVVYNTTYYNGSYAGDVDPSRIIHWSERVAGPDAGGTSSLVQAFDFNGYEEMCGQFGHNLLNNGWVILSECDNRLYTIWSQMGDPDIGDSTDCVDENTGPAFLGAYNGDLHMSVSMSLNGALWDARRNLTNSKTPLCDGTDGNACDHDAWPTMSRFGMDSRVSVIGDNYWSSAPEAFDVRDALDASYPDSGFYLDVQYIDDLLPESAMFLGTEYWTDNPIKWFRLPCLSPIIKPAPYYPREVFRHPYNWVKSGTEVALDIEVGNIGNAVLNISGISASILQGGSGWLQINTSAMVVQPGTSETASFTLNPGGAITAPPGAPIAIEAWVLFDNEDSELGIDSFYINSVIADTVVQVTYEVVTTGQGVQLGVLNNGSFGNYPNTGGYLAFYDKQGGIDEDCDSQEVYLYDASPIIMYDANTFFWNTYYDAANHDGDVNFIPVLSEIKSESCLSGGMDQNISSTFVTADSAIGMNKVWAAPEDDVSYVIEKWQLFSYDGALHTGVQIAEWVDCDVPSDTNVNNLGTIVQADDYVYVTGQETDFNACLENNSRFYVHGLLGYYWQSDFNSDPNINNTGLAGAYVTQTEELMTTGYDFIPDSLWSYLTKNEFNANSSWVDQRTLLSFGSFDIIPGDTLVIWIMHGVLINSDQTGVSNQVTEAKAWYLDNRENFGFCGCCGNLTGGYPGNANCDAGGLRDLADITRLIDNVYISKLELCCPGNGNVNGDVAGLVDLADITKLIDHVYISKAEVPPCL